MKILDSTSLTDEDQDLMTTKTKHSNFHIQFDYRYDTNGWFDDAKKACLEYAASLWENVITSDFSDIAAGTSLKVTNPNNGQYENVSLSYNIDDIVIFVGAINIASSWYNSTTATAFGGMNVLKSDGSTLNGTIGGRTNNSTNFQPSTGTIVFDMNPHYSNGSSATWFVDSTPSTINDIPSRGYYDFISIAVHEIGHVLGIGTGSNTYKSVISNSKFYGSHTVEINGDGVPITGANGHISESYYYDGQSPILSTLGAYRRRNPSVIDYACCSALDLV